MNNITTTNKPSSQPLERKKIFGSVLDNPEYIEKKDRIGFPEDDELDNRGFDATIGSINFSMDTVVPLSDVSDMFSGSDQWIVFKPADIADKASGVVSKTVNLVSGAASDGLDAGSDLLNQITGREQTPKNPEPENPEDQEKAKALAEYTEERQVEENIGARVMKIHRDLESRAQLEATRERVSNLAGIQKWLEDMVDETGEVRIDLQTSVEQKARELQEKELQATKPLESPSKHGAKGSRLSNEDNKSGETHQTAQTATG